METERERCTIIMFDRQAGRKMLMQYAQQGGTCDDANPTSRTL